MAAGHQEIRTQSVGVVEGTMIQNATQYYKLRIRAYPDAEVPPSLKYIAPAMHVQGWRTISCARRCEAVPSAPVSPAQRAVTVATLHVEGYSGDRAQNTGECQNATTTPANLTRINFDPIMQEKVVQLESNSGPYACQYL